MGEQKSLVRAADYAACCQAARIIAQGGVVAFPTDTVYGLGCDLYNTRAVERIYAIKGRPAHLPLIAMFSEAAQWPQVATALPPIARRYMQEWWPGPLTIIVEARPDIPARVLGGGTTIGMRIPDQADARLLLRLAGRPLATTSANLSGHPAACSAEEVAEQLADSVDFILDAGACAGGIPSTLVDCTVTPPKVLREGPVTAAMLGLG
ncbi:MAG: L-threonylcarbamoyladenylate synthase [Armatimonadota bacterium]